MCGIVGYVGYQEASEVLVSGLSRLEYRGYDSAGIAVLRAVEGDSNSVQKVHSELQVRRAVGKLRNLKFQLTDHPVTGQVGIGHTRWATHGRPSEANAHPHTSGSVTVVHNGIIENHLELKTSLQARGIDFQSETDTEVFSHLVAERLDTRDPHGLLNACQSALTEVEGSYAFVVISSEFPDQIFAARQGSPMVVGVGQDESLIASDVSALLSYTRDVIFLEEGDQVLITAQSRMIYNDHKEVERQTKRVHWSPAQAEKGGYKHFMLKEIFEQPRAVIDTCAGRLSASQGLATLGEVQLSAERLSTIQRIYICACGTAWHAGLVAKRDLERFLRIPVEVDLASEFRYRDPVVDERTLMIVVSQSGETADTYAALLEAKRRGAYTLSVCNVMESSIARACDDVIYTHAGPEISVASTKAFSTQVIALKLLALHLGSALGRVSSEVSRAEVKAITRLPRLLEEVLSSRDEVRKVARTLVNVHHCLFLGRGAQHAIALEGALKLKEISYIHAEGYAAGEMKHGPIALVDEEMPVVVLCPQDAHYEKTLSNLQEVKARGGRVIAIATQGDEKISAQSDVQIWIPKAPDALLPLMTTLPLQLLAYDVADLKGTDVDQPRNLAKSVTVE
jgi:glucosamine--fructose-6-phosphate aminotransferase (isomerizing)